MAEINEPAESLWFDNNKLYVVKDHGKISIYDISNSGAIYSN